MCLTLENSRQASKIAEKDIVCYKFLKKKKGLTSDRSFRESLHGKSCKVTINHYEEDAIISVDLYGAVFFCQNNHQGNNVENKFGFKYSWMLDYNVSSIVVDGLELFLYYYITPYQEAEVKIGETYVSILHKQDNKIYAGLHSMVNSEDVRKVTGMKAELIECIIPKGSEYYEGSFNGHPSYASNQLKYVKKIISKI